MPKQKGITPGYGQKSFETELNQKKLTLVVSEDEREGSIGINQDADLYISRLSANESLEFSLRPSRGAWIQIVKGRVDVNGQVLATGDALSIEEEPLLKFKALEGSEFLLFDLA